MLGILEKKAQTTTKPLPIPFGTQSFYQSRTNLEIAQTGIVYRCIKLRADSFASYNQKVLIDGKEVENHPIYDLIADNNWNQIKSLLLQWLDMSGNSYLYFYEYATKSYQIYVMPSSQTKVNTGKQNEALIKSYVFGSNIVMPNEVLHLRTLAPSNDFYKNTVIGTPTLLNASMDLLQVEKQALDYFERKLLRDNTEHYYLSTESVNQNEKRQLKEFFNSIVPNNLKALAVLGNGEELKSLKPESKDILSINLREIQETITNIWGVPFRLLDGNTPNRNTADVIEYNFQNQVVFPLVQTFNSELTKFFRKLYNDNRIEIVSDEPIYTDYEYYLKEMQFDVTHGIKSRNEIRTERNLEAIPDGDIYLSTNGLTAINNLLQQRPENIELSKSNEAMKYIVWKNINDTRDYYQNRIEKSVSDTFKQLENELISNLEKSLNKEINLGIDLFDISKWRDIIAKTTTKPVGDLITKIAKDSLKAINENTSLTSWEKRISAMTKNSTDKIRDSINTIHDGTKLAVQKVIAENPLIGATELLSKITEKTKYLFSEVYTKSRAKMIADTTATYSTTLSQRSVFSEYNYDLQWLSSRDNKTRDAHIDADGQIAIDGYFRVGGESMKHPGGGSDASNNINCRCYILPVKKI